MPMSIDRESTNNFADAMLQALGGTDGAAALFLRHADQFAKDEQTAHYAPPLRQAVADMLRGQQTADRESFAVSGMLHL